MAVSDAQIELEAQPGVTLTRDVPFATSPRQATLNLVGDATKKANPDTIGFRTLDRIRREPTVSAGLRILTTILLRNAAQATAQCDDPSIQRYLQATLIDSGLWYRLVKISLSALWAGVQFAEKCWDVVDLTLDYEVKNPDGTTETHQAWDGPALVIKELRDLNPETVTSIKVRQAPAGSDLTHDPKTGKPLDGSFDGFYWNDGQTAGGEDVWIAPQKAYIYAHDVEFGNLWGRARIRDAYTSHHWLDFVQKTWAAWLEQEVIRHKVVRYPAGDTVVNGQKLTNASLALQLGNDLDTNSVVAMTNTRDKAGEYQWNLEEAPHTDATPVFKETAEYWEQRELRAMFVPQKVYDNNEVGSYSSATAYQDFFLLTADALLTDIGEYGNNYVTTPQAVAAFGANIPDARINMPGLTDADRARLEAVTTALLADANFLARIDADAVADEAKIPLSPKPEQAPAVPAAPAAPGPETPQTANPVPGAPAPAGTPPPAPPAPAPAAGQNIAADDWTGVAFTLADLQACAGELGLADVISLAAGFDPAKWTVTPDPSSKLQYAVHYASGPFAGKRLLGFAAAKVIESWQKAAGSAAKKGATAAKSAANKSAAQAKRDAAASQAEARRQERDALKQQKELERQQRDAEKQAEQKTRQAESQGRTVLAAARAERAQMEISTRRQNPQQVAQTLRNRGWEQVGGQYVDRQAAETAAHQAAAQQLDHTFTIVATKDGYVVARKDSTKITVPASAPNVAADDWAPIWEPLLADAAGRLMPLFVTELTAEDLQEVA